MTDPIADMLTRIRNALAIKRDKVILPYSKFKFELAKVFEKESWIKRVEVLNPEKDKEKFKQIKLTLKYDQKKNSKIKSIRRVSRPGCRIYVKKDKIQQVLNGFGSNIISTSSGIMSGQQAKEKGLGGELICELW